MPSMQNEMSEFMSHIEAASRRTSLRVTKNDKPHARSPWRRGKSVEKVRFLVEPCEDYTVVLQHASHVGNRSRSAETKSFSTRDCCFFDVVLRSNRNFRDVVRRESKHC